VKVAAAFALIGLFLVAVVLGVYLTQAPDVLTDDYREQAQPEQLKLRRAMRPVYRTFNVFTFGVDNTPIRKSKNERQFVRAIAKVSAESLRELRPARRAIDRARRALKKADEDKLFDAPEAPLLNDRGKLPDTRAIADDERRYLSKARRFLRDYDRLVAYEIKGIEFLQTTGTTVARGFDKIPRTFTAAGQFTGPVEGVIRSLQRSLRTFRKRKPPADLKAEHRAIVRDTEFLIARLREMNAAARRFDNAGLQKAVRQLRGHDKALERGALRSLRRLIGRSATARAIRELRKRERELSSAFAGL
jgi:hypothetical protein